MDSVRQRVLIDSNVKFSDDCAHALVTCPERWPQMWLEARYSA